MNKFCLPVALAGLLLTGCSASWDDSWVNPYRDLEYENEAYFNQDLAYCEGFAEWVVSGSGNRLEAFLLAPEYPAASSQYPYGSYAYQAYGGGPGAISPLEPQADDSGIFARAAALGTRVLSMWDRKEAENWCMREFGWRKADR